MNVCADLLACLSRPKDADDRHFGPVASPRGVISVRKGRIKFRRYCLIMVNAVQTDSKRLHLSLKYAKRMVAGIAQAHSDPSQEQGTPDIQNWSRDIVLHGHAFLQLGSSTSPCRGNPD